MVTLTNLKKNAKSFVVRSLEATDSSANNIVELAATSTDEGSDSSAFKISSIITTIVTISVLLLHFV
jgi:hypothetical protein